MKGAAERVLAFRVTFILGLIGLFAVATPHFIHSSRVEINPDPSMAETSILKDIKLQHPSFASTKPLLVPQKVVEQSGQALRFTFKKADEHFLTFDEAVVLLASEDSDRGGLEFRKQMAGILSTAPFEAIFWECAPVSAASASRYQH